MKRSCGRTQSCMKADAGSSNAAGIRSDVVCSLLCFLLLAPARPARCAVPDVGATRAAGRERCFSYTNQVIPEKPWSIHIVKVERHRPEFVFYSTLGKGDTLGMGIVSDQIRSVPVELGQPVAAINGDFYEKAEGYEGRPRDLQVCGGEVVSSPAGHTCFWMDTAQEPHMTNVFSLFRVVWGNGKTTPVGLNEARDDDKAVLYTAPIGVSTRTCGGQELILEPSGSGPWVPLRIGMSYAATVRQVSTNGNSAVARDSIILSLGPTLAARLPQSKPGDALRIITETVPDLSGVQVAIGGGPALVRDAAALEWKGYVHVRHPRTALGWNRNHMFLVEVDGRQSSSVGMTFEELAQYLVKLGCEQAMNLDGGGSATLWALGAVRNSPSEGQERPSPNALVLVRKKAYAGSVTGLSTTNYAGN